MLIKKLPARKIVPLPAFLRKLVMLLFEAEGSQLPDILQKISYSSLPKSDLNNWIGVLNKLDGILENIISKYNLKEVQVLDFSEEDKELVLSVLTLTRTLFDKCTNRNLYCSYERLNELLNTNDIDVLEMVLVVVMRPAQRVNAQRTVRMNFLISQDRIKLLASKWNLSPHSSNLLELIKPTSVISDEDKALSFRFYRNSTTSGMEEILEKVGEDNNLAATDSENLSPVVRIHLKDPFSRGSTATEIYLNLISEYDVPLNDRRNLFHKIQIVTSIVTPESRAKMFSIRQLSIAIYCYMVSENSANKTIFFYDPTLINDLVSLLTPDAGIPLNVLTSSLNALDAISHYSGKINDVLNAIGVSANHGVLISLIKKVASLEDKNDLRFMALVDTLFAFLGFIFASQSGGSMLISAGILPILVKFLTPEMNDAPRRLVYKGIQLMDNAIYGFPTAFTSFQSVNGLPLLVNRIEEQVEWCISSCKDDTTADFNLADNIAKVEGMILLKGLIKFVLHMMQTSSTGVGLRNLIDTSLPNSLKRIFAAPQLFAPTVYGQAINIMSTIIHNEPTSLSVLQEQHLPQTFLASIIDQIPNSSDTLFPIVNSFGAICLNPQGLSDFTNSTVLTKVFEAFLTPKYIDILEEPDACNSIGNSLDELIRHNPSLRQQAIDAIFSVIYALVDYGNDKFSVWEALIAPYIEKDLNEGLHLHLIEVIEKASDTPDFGSIQKEKTPILYLLRLIDVFCQFLFSFLNTADSHFNAFNGGGGADLLLEFYSMKAAPYNFPSTSAAKSLSRVFRCSSEDYMKNVIKTIMRRIFSAMDKSDSWINYQGQESFMVNLLISNTAEREADLKEIFALLNELNGLTGLLNELCDPHFYNQSNLIYALTDSFIKCEDLSFIPRLGHLLSVVQLERIKLSEFVIVSCEDPSILPEDDIYKYASTEAKNILSPFDFIASNIIATFKDFSKLMLARRTMSTMQKKNAKTLSLNMAAAVEDYFKLNRVGQEIDNCSTKYYTTAFEFMNAITIDKRHVQFIHLLVLMSLEQHGVFNKAMDLMIKMVDHLIALKSDLSCGSNQASVHKYLNATLSLEDFFSKALPFFECLSSPKSYESIYLSNFLPRPEEPNFDQITHPNLYLSKIRSIFSDYLTRFWECEKQLVFSDELIVQALNSSTVIVKNAYLQISETRARNVHPALANFLSIRRPTVTINQERLDQMVEMGYPRGGSETALLRNQNNISRAIDYLSEHPELYAVNTIQTNDQQDDDQNEELGEEYENEGSNGGRGEPTLEDIIENYDNPAPNEGVYGDEDEDAQLSHDHQDDESDDASSDNIEEGGEVGEEGEVREEGEGEEEDEEEGPELDAQREESFERLTDSRAYRFYLKDFFTFCDSKEAIEKHTSFKLTVENHLFDLMDCSALIKISLRDLFGAMLESGIQSDIQLHLINKVKESFAKLSEGSHDQLTSYLELTILLLSHSSALELISGLVLEIFDDLCKAVETLVESNSEELDSCTKVVLSTMLMVLVMSTEIIPEHLATNFTALSDIDSKTRFPKIIDRFSQTHQESLTRLCIKAFGTNYARSGETFMIIIKLLTLLTQRPGNVAVFCKENGPESLLNLLKACPTNLKQHSYIMHLLSNLVESRDVLLYAMRQLINHKIKKGGMPYDLKSFIKQNYSLIFRDQEVFMDAMLLEVKVTSYDGGSSLPLIGARKQSDPVAEHLVEENQREGVPPLDKFGLSLLGLLIKEVLNFEHSETAELDVTNDKDYVLAYKCFILHALFDLFHYHPSCRFSFLSGTKHKGESKEQPAITLPSRSHFINKLLNTLLPYDNLEQEAYKTTELQGALSSYALFTISSLVVGRSDFYLETIGIDFAPTRRYVLELIHASFSDTLNLPSSLKKYCKLVSLNDLCSHLLQTKSLGPMYYQKPDENCNTSTATLLFKLKFPHLLISLLDSLDTEAPGMIRVLNSALRPLDTLSKVAIRVGQENKDDESTVTDIPQSEDNESASEAEAAEDFVRGSYISVYAEPADQHQDEYFSEEDAEDPGFSSESVEEYDEFDIEEDGEDEEGESSDGNSSAYSESGSEEGVAMEVDVDVDGEEVVDESDDIDEEEGSVHIQTVFEGSNSDDDNADEEYEEMATLMEELQSNLEANALSATPEDSEDEDGEQPIHEVLPITMEFAPREPNDGMFLGDHDRAQLVGRATHEVIANQLSQLRNTFGIIRASRNRANAPNPDVSLTGQNPDDPFSVHRRRIINDFSSHPMVHAELAPGLTAFTELFPTIEPNRGNRQQQPLRMAASRILVQLMSQPPQNMSSNREGLPFEIFGNLRQGNVTDLNSGLVAPGLRNPNSEVTLSTPISFITTYRNLDTHDRWAHMVDASYGFANHGIYNKIIFKVVHMLIRVYRESNPTPPPAQADSPNSQLEPAVEPSDAPIATLNPHTPILAVGEVANSNVRSNVAEPPASVLHDMSVEPIIRESIMINGELVDITNSGIDRTFLEALPDDLRQEVLLQHLSGDAPPIEVPESNTIGQEFLDAIPDAIRESVLRSEQAVLQNNQASNEEVQIEQSESLSNQQPDVSVANPPDNVDAAPEEPAAIQTGLELPNNDELQPTIRPIHFIERLGDSVRNRFIGTSRSNNNEHIGQRNKEALQITDREELATLIKLLFIPHSHNRSPVAKVLVNLSLNPKTCSDLIGMLLLLVQDDVSDIESLEKLFSNMSIKSRKHHHAKGSKPQLRETVPNLIPLKCLEMMNQLISMNSSSIKCFLTDLEAFSAKKPTKKARGKEKEGGSKYPLNILLSLLERPKYLEDVSLMDNVMKLLSQITKQLASQIKHDRLNESGSIAPVPVEANEGTILEEAPENTGTGETAEPSNSKAARHPPITDNNYKLIINILTSEKCSTKTFQHTLVTIQQLSITTKAESIFIAELIGRSKMLSNSILEDITEAHFMLEQDAKEDVHSMILTKFSQPSSDQTKFLRLLKTLDFMQIRKENSYRKLKKLGSKHAAKMAKERGSPLFYRDLHGLNLWAHLSDLLAMIQDHSELLGIATVLLPLIEAFMVICKHSGENGGKPSLIDVKREESFENTLFFHFTDRHRDLLNTIIRDNPALMNGTFSLLIKNHKVLDFDNKRNYFHQELHKRSSERDYSSTLQVNVRRNTVFEDSFRQFQGRNGDEIKYAKLNIKFADEEGVDAGGVTREWFSVLSRQMFDPNNALFLGSAADRVTYQPNRLSSINPDHLLFFKFVGRVIGKAIYDSNVLDAYFTRAFYKHILGRPVELKDLEATDPTYYNSLVWILENDITNVMELTFSVEIDDFGVNTVHDLIPGGRDIAVTEANKHEYVHLVVQQKLYTAIKDQTDSFLKGFHEIIPEKLIGIFDEQELELLISGLPDIDIDDWRNNTSYNGFTSTSPQVTWFWRMVRTMDPEHRAKLLQFVTGTSKVPLEGFASLQGSTGIQKFQIHKDYSSTKRLPTSHTCFNQLDLPLYETYEELRKQILIAIQEGATGFGFS